MAFDDYLSQQAKKRDHYRTPMQDIDKAGKVHQEIFGIGREAREFTKKDWQRLDEAESKARVAKNFLRDGTYDKGGNC
jgi:hypothetical protein